MESKDKGKAPETFTVAEEKSSLFPRIQGNENSKIPNRYCDEEFKTNAPKGI